MASMGRFWFYIGGKLYSFGYNGIRLSLLWIGVGNLIAGFRYGDHPVRISLAISPIYMGALGYVAFYLSARILG